MWLQLRATCPDAATVRERTPLSPQDVAILRDTLPATRSSSATSTLQAAKVGQCQDYFVLRCDIRRTYTYRIRSLTSSSWRIANEASARRAALYVATGRRGSGAASIKRGAKQRYHACCRRVQRSKEAVGWAHLVLGAWRTGASRRGQKQVDRRRAAVSSSAAIGSEDCRSSLTMVL